VRLGFNANMCIPYPKYIPSFPYTLVRKKGKLNIKKIIVEKKNKTRFSVEHKQGYNIKIKTPPSKTYDKLEF